MKVLTVVGARPQFIKASPLSRALREDGHNEYLVHTGQHYDHEMSDIFFEELSIPQPDVNLGVGSSSHGAQTGRMLEQLETIIKAERPDWVLVYGDTNSTLAGALAACKLRISIAHVEAGLRSFNRAMPEEHNRVLTDHCSDLLFCPTQTAVDNLAAEGIKTGVHLVGDVMLDSLLFAAEQAQLRSNILADLGVAEKGYLLATVHRAENTDDLTRLERILNAFNALDELILFPLHPRTRRAMETLDYVPGPHVRLMEPLGYLHMVRLQQSARAILTDSGGIQKEAYWLGVPCITLRDETEWVETISCGWNKLVGSEEDLIIDAVRSAVRLTIHPMIFGDAGAAARCLSLMKS